MRIALTLLLLFCASAAKAADEVKPAQDQYQHFLDLLNDDDWLTGVWDYESDASMSLYALIEKTTEGYIVKYYFPRYTVTWWTGKVEKHGDKVLTWDYEIVGDKLLLPDNPTDIETYKDGILSTTTTKAMQKYYEKRSQVTDPVGLKSFAEEEFITGESYLKGELEKKIQDEKAIPHYDLITKSKKLQDMGDIQQIEIVIAAKRELDEFYLIKIELAGPSHSGMCGSSAENGYYWVHFQRQKEDWKLKDEWNFTVDECREGKWVVLNKESETRSALLLNSLRADKEIGLECFEFNPKDISEKPKPCATDQAATPKN